MIKMSYVWRWVSFIFSYVLGTNEELEWGSVFFKKF